MLNQSASFGILDRILSRAGGDEADAVLVATDHNISRFANSTVHQNMSETTAALTLRVFLGGAVGVASTSSFDDAELARTAEIARESARHGNPSPRFSGLYRDASPAPDLATFDDDTAAIPPAEKARALRAMFDRGAGKGLQFAGAYRTAASSVACGNSHAIRRYVSFTAADATVIALGNGSSGYATACGRRAADVSIEALGEEATFRATLALGKSEDVNPGEYDVILEPAAIAEVLEWMTMIAFTGQSYEDGSSFLVGNEGKKLVHEDVTIADDSTDPEFLPFPFDVEGLTKRRVPIIERGVAGTPMLDKLYADRLGLAPNGGAWHLGSPEHGTAFHLDVAAGTSDRQSLIPSTRLGIWITRFNYVNGLLEPRTALMTGTTRDGTFLVRDGEVVARLPNLRWTQSILEALSRVDGITSTRARIATWYNMFGGTIAPAMRIRGWRITGKQER